MTFGLGLTAALFIVAGALHFVVPRFYLAIMPAYLPSPLALVYLSGAIEVLGGVGLLFGVTRTAAAVGLILLLVAVFPANVEMLRQAQMKGASTLFIVGCWLRLPLQALMVWWVWRVAHTSHDLSR